MLDIKSWVSWNLQIIEEWGRDKILWNVTFGCYDLVLMAVVGFDVDFKEPANPVLLIRNDAEDIA